ncbi:MAG: tRNA dihydrouridine synthase DusB [Deltaproteobacteria bacterium]|nr:tRNA dihydrouridine synthase DusB [Deltaproteobacteria bacterium]
MIHNGKGIKIGSLELRPPVLLAPMAAITTPAVRKIAEEFGAGATFTEMISAAALFRGIKAARSLVRKSGENAVFASQIFGSDAHEMAYAAWYLVDNGVQWIDINMGCPMKDIISNGSGAALMKSPEKAGEIVSEVLNSAGKFASITVKFRAGWDFASINAPEFAAEMEKAGAMAMTVHGRTRSQIYTGSSNPEIIRDVKKSVKVPVIANGDIKTAADAARILEITGADGVMLARGTFGNPWMVKDIVHYFESGEVVETPITPEHRLEIILKHLDLIEMENGPDSLQQSRKQIAWYSKNVRDSSTFRKMVFSTPDIDSLRNLAREIFTR